MHIEIKNWEKYNKRADIKSPHWFAISNRFFDDPDFYSFSAAEKLAFIYILAQCSLCNSPKIMVHNETFARRSGLDAQVFEGAFDKLEKIGVISISSRDTNVPRTRSGRIRTPHDMTGHDTTLHDTTKHENGQPVQTDSSRTQRIKAIFLESYEKNLGRKYVSWEPKHTAMLTNWLKGISENEAARLIDLYPQWNDQWVTKQGHPIEVFFKQANQVNAWFTNPENHVNKLAAGQHQKEKIDQLISKEKSVYGYNDHLQKQRGRGDGIRSQIPNQSQPNLPRASVERDDRPEFVEPPSQGDFGSGAAGF